MSNAITLSKIKEIVEDSVSYFIGNPEDNQTVWIEQLNKYVSLVIGYAEGYDRRDTDFISPAFCTTMGLCYMIVLNEDVDEGATFNEINMPIWNDIYQWEVDDTSCSFTSSSDAISDKTIKYIRKRALDVTRNARDKMYQKGGC